MKASKRRGPQKSQNEPGFYPLPGFRAPVLLLALPKYGTKGRKIPKIGPWLL
jgi:hypothetical protein